MHSYAQQLRKKITAGQGVHGTFLVEFNSPAAVSILANAGFDFVMFDCEHGLYSPRDVGHLVEAAYNAGVAGIVRVPSPDRAVITQALDAGAAGILVPAIADMKQVREVVRATKYKPIGKRGVHLLRGHTRHRGVHAGEFLKEANRDLLTLIQIELEDALHIVDEIAATEGVDGLYIGPGDLSVDLGVPGGWDSPKILEAVKTTATACRKHGKILGCHYDSPTHLPMLHKVGVQMFGHFCDSGLFQQAVMQAQERFVKATQRSPRSK